MAKWVKFAAVGVLATQVLGGAADAQSIWDKVKKGAQETGEAIGEGAEAAGEAITDGFVATGDAINKGAKSVEKGINKGAAAVSESWNSTSELLSNEETPEQTRARLDAMAVGILGQLVAQNPQAAELYAQSAGYAAFDSREVTIFPLSTAYGRGVAVQKDGTDRTYMNMASGGVGAGIGIGGFEVQFVVLFETPADYERFVTKGYDATAEGGAQAGKDGGSEGVRFTQGQSVFVLDKNAWRVNASLAGTKYWRSPELN